MYPNLCLANCLFYCNEVIHLSLSSPLNLIVKELILAQKITVLQNRPFKFELMPILERSTLTTSQINSGNFFSLPIRLTNSRLEGIQRWETSIFRNDFSLFFLDSAPLAALSRTFSISSGQSHPLLFIITNSDHGQRSRCSCFNAIVINPARLASRACLARIGNVLVDHCFHFSTAEARV